MSSALSLIVFGNVCFFGILSLVVPSNSNPVLRDDYTYTPGIGGHKVHKQAAKWNDARSICRQEGGDLAIINSEAESKIIVKLLSASRPHIGSFDDGYAHIGFHDLFEEGQYETVDGKSLSEAGFNEWAVGEPNNDPATVVGNCGSIHYDGKLNDISCGKRLAFVCELPGLAEVAQENLPQNRHQSTK